jgi:hypothetical protein
MVHNTSETDDFGAFNTGNTQPKRPSGAPRRAPQQRPQKPTGFKSSSIVIAIAAVVVVVLLIVLIAALVGGSNKDIEFTDNAYVAYTDADGLYHVAANGTVVGDFENEVTLIPADDNSFAYVIENNPDGYTIHLVQGKKSERITDAPVDKVLATAGLAPGVVWLEADIGVYCYSDGEVERITKDYDTFVADPYGDVSDPYNYLCHMSADASTVIYAKTDPEKAPQFNLYVFSESNEQKSRKNLYPVAISDDGSLIYGFGISAKDRVTRTLSVITPDGESHEICQGFSSIIDITPEGNEIVFTTNTDSGIMTYLFAFNPKKIDSDASPAKIGKGIVTPVILDPEVARLSTFKNTYFQTQTAELELTKNAPTYYVNKKYEKVQVSGFAGKFDTKGEYFFYTNDDNTLQYIKLDDDKYTPQRITDDIVAFEVTQKGNVYWLNDSDRLSYYDVSKDESKKIRDDVAEISMHKYANKLYFQTMDGTTVYSTEEGSKEDDVKFDSVSIAGTPIFAKANLKKTFAAVYDYDNDEWRIYYTANGRSYKYIAPCIDIEGFDVSDILDGILGDNGSQLPG